MRQIFPLNRTSPKEQNKILNDKISRYMSFCRNPAEHFDYIMMTPNPEIIQRFNPMGGEYMSLRENNRVPVLSPPVSTAIQKHFIKLFKNKEDKK